MTVYKINIRKRDCPRQLFSITILYKTHIGNLNYFIFQIFFKPNIILPNNLPNYVVFQKKKKNLVFSVANVKPFQNYFLLISIYF